MKLTWKEKSHISKLFAKYRADPDLYVAVVRYIERRK